MNYNGKVRIIAGQWRGRKLNVPDKVGLRPTPDRVRETLFNWLAPIINGAQCLDLFAGTGALGIEAASRGAQNVILVEKDIEIVKILRESVKLLQAPHIAVHCSDALQFLQQGISPCDIVFLDPPFSLNLWQSACEYLEKQGWLKAQAHIYVEMPREMPLFNLPPHWYIKRQQAAGQIAYYLLVRTVI